MVYLIVIIIGILLSLIFDGKAKLSKNKFVNLYIFILVLISAISNNLGGDAYTYRERFDLYGGDLSFENLAMWTLLYGYMPLWTLVNETAAALGCSYAFVQILISFSINVVIGCFIKKNSDFPFISLVIYFLVSYFYLNFEVQREAFAIAVGFIGLNKYLNGDKKTFWICTAIAILFHISAICLLLFPFIPKFRLNWFRLFMAFCISLLIYITSDYLVRFIPAFNGSIGDRVVGYASSTVTIFGFLLHTIRRMFVPFVSYLIVRHIFLLKYRYINQFIPFYLCFSILACALPGTFRFINYMIPISILIMADLIAALFKNKLKGKNIILAIFVCFLYTSQNIANMSTYFPISGYHRYDLYFPYSTIFDEYNDYSYRDQIHQEALSGGTSENTRKN